MKNKLVTSCFYVRGRPIHFLKSRHFSRKQISHISLVLRPQLILWNVKTAPWEKYVLVLLTQRNPGKQEKVLLALRWCSFKPVMPDIAPCRFTLIMTFQISSEGTLSNATGEESICDAASDNADRFSCCLKCMICHSCNTTAHENLSMEIMLEEHINSRVPNLPLDKLHLQTEPQIRSHVLNAEEL